MEASLFQTYALRRAEVRGKICLADLMRITAIATLLLAAGASMMLIAESLRDDWQHLRDDLNFYSQLNHSLADMSLSARERAQIRGAIEHERDYPGNQREEMRKMILGSRAGAIKPTRGSGQLILVRGAEQFCGATGNCSFWLFIRQGGNDRLILSGEGQGLFEGKRFHHGLPDLVVTLHDSAFRTDVSVYSWNGRGYEQADCYFVTYDMTDRSKEPAITGCKAGRR